MSSQEAAQPSTSMDLSTLLTSLPSSSRRPTALLIVPQAQLSVPDSQGLSTDSSSMLSGPEDIRNKKTSEEDQGSKSSTSCSTGPESNLPDLPIEILEQIFGFVFLRPTLTTPSSSLPSVPTHLLLVSHSFRQLALPFFYNSIRIVRPLDFITFFDPREGIFVVGEESEKRWNYVKEIVVRKDVHPPLRRFHSDSDTLLVPLTLPSRRRISHLCILDNPSPPTSWLDQGGIKELLLQITIQPDRRRDALERLQGFYEDAAQQHPDGTLLTFLEWLDDPDFESEEEATGAFISRLIASETKSRLEDEQEQFFDSLVISTSPRILRDRYSPTLDLSMRLYGSESPFKVDSFALHFNEEQTPTKAFLYQAMERVGKITNAAHVHLVDYPQEVREKFIAWIRRRGIPTTTVSILRWSWQAEDGTVMQLNLEDLSTSTVSPISTWLV
ncbi:hypothetical protein BDY24DRAFT_26816 [Mrakia frigida]|uniref:uncharacterized protein n=1 Tax=Mrakia frigida TaxID=29902 RepID=UPI003FCC0D4F